MEYFCTCYKHYDINEKAAVRVEMSVCVWEGEGITRIEKRNSH